MNERELKKQLRKLKQLRTAVIVGENRQYTETQLNEAIERVRVQLGTAEDREIVLSYEPYEWQYLEGLGHSLEEYNRMIKSGMTNSSIAYEWEVNLSAVITWLKKEEEKEMAKLTLEKYKDFVEQGMKPKEIAEKTGLSQGSVYAYKQKWKMKVC